MSYLTKLVNNAKSTSGFTGRQGGEYARLDRKRKKSDEQVDQDSGSSRWYLYVGGGLALLVGGVLVYKKFKGNSIQRSQALSGKGKNQEPEKVTDPELRQKLREVKDRNRELNKKSKNQEPKTDLEKFVEKVPASSLKNKEGII